MKAKPNNHVKLVENTLGRVLWVGPLPLGFKQPALKTLLSQHGFTLSWVPTAKKAMAWLEKPLADLSLVVIAQALPDWPGQTLCHCLKASPAYRQTGVVLMLQAGQSSYQAETCLADAFFDCQQPPLQWLALFNQVVTTYGGLKPLALTPNQEPSSWLAALAYQNLQAVSFTGKISELAPLAKTLPLLVPMLFNLLAQQLNAPPLMGLWLHSAHPQAKPQDADEAWAPQLFLNQSFAAQSAAQANALPEQALLSVPQWQEALSQLQQQWQQQSPLGVPVWAEAGVPEVEWILSPLPVAAVSQALEEPPAQNALPSLGLPQLYWLQEAGGPCWGAFFVWPLAHQQHEFLAQMPLILPGLGDLARLVGLHRQLQALAVEDVVTGLLNGSAFLERLETEVMRAQRYGTPLSLLLLEVSGLRHANQQEGFGKGNRLLAYMAGQLQATFRQTDILARITSGQFAVLLPQARQEMGHLVLQRLQHQVSQTPLVLEGRLYPVALTGVCLDYPAVPQAAEPQPLPAAKFWEEAQEQLMALQPKPGPVRLSRSFRR